tara:strand:- start:11269 stop:11736 length:468 start_codon:yes stop_codon:yes gene_type:complete
MKLPAAFLSIAIFSLSSLSAGEFDKPFFISLSGDWNGSGSLVSEGKTIPITPARVRAEDKKNGTFTLEGDITINGDLGLYSMTFAESNGVITVEYANSDGVSVTMNALVDYAEKTALIKGPERVFRLKLDSKALFVELTKTGADAATAKLSLVRQ